MSDSVERILVYWFGDLAADPDAWKSKSSMWWNSGDTDKEVAGSFGDALSEAENGDLDAWRDGARSCLAFVILCDQFSRNVYRGTTRAFSNDERALSATYLAIDRGLDLKLRSVERGFLYMPTMHSEKIEHQDRCIKLFQSISEQHPAFLASAHKHRDVIVEYGRFPHRNSILSRESTEAEKAYLAKGGGF